MSLDLKADVLKAANDAQHLTNKKPKRLVKKPQHFIIKFPNGVEAMIKCPNGWTGVNGYLKYFKDEYGDNIVFISINKRETRKFTRKGVLFNVNK